MAVKITTTELISGAYVEEDYSKGDDISAIPEGNLTVWSDAPNGARRILAIFAPGTWRFAEVVHGEG